ncbi:MAG: phenylalanine--tRNA ligase subunit beta [Clostridiales bacterium]|jgi:phenylalanyl-tRNA synthetase beta chain|nr:phenylalanine--tRNA ligase subunit beta [Clostridiales bacterium]
MLLSEKWLKDYTDPCVSQKEFIDAMTMSGSKVEGYKKEGAELSNIVVGKILSLIHHNNSEHLWICEVDAGEKGVLQIVTGAQNLKVGDYVPVALDNSVVFGGKEIKKGVLRGVESFGMLCSLTELGLSVHDFPYALGDGIFVLGDDCDKTLGLDIKEAIGLLDTVTEFEITPNRPDCLSVLGLAREAAATFNKPIKYPHFDIKNKSGDINELLSVKIKSPEKCCRYCAAIVKNARVEPSPLWLRERLRASGVRPINNIVDITNFVMLEMGQPMHAFDYRLVKDASIVVRNAALNENITTLDGIERQLDGSILVIADSEKPVAVAGVMGGEYSGVMDDTTTLIFESACFNGSSVRKTSKKLGLRTESSSRFEKGLDREICDKALLRALSLIEQLNAGDIVGGIIDCYPTKKEPTVIPLNHEWVNSFLGIELSVDEHIKILEKLEFKIKNGNIYVPSFREDVTHQADISEEIARFYGYQNIPDLELTGVADGRLTVEQAFEKTLTDLMTAFGAFEIVTYSFFSPKAYDKILLPPHSEKRNSVTISNPLGEDTSIMRTTALPSLLDALSRNYNNRNKEAFLFELSALYKPNGKDELPEETEALVAGMYGENADFYTLKGIIEELFNKIGIRKVGFEALTNNPSYHPGRTAQVFIDNEFSGVIGEIHPDVLNNYEIDVKCFVFELCFEKLLKNAVKNRIYKPLPKFPAATRDLALVCDINTPASKLSDIIKYAVGDWLESIKLFDVYKGQQVPDDKKSVAFSLTLRANDRTLTDEQADYAVQNALKELEKNGITLRV